MRRGYHTRLLGYNLDFLYYYMFLEQNITMFFITILETLFK